MGSRGLSLDKVAYRMRKTRLEIREIEQEALRKCGTPLLQSAA